MIYPIILCNLIRVCIILFIILEINEVTDWTKMYQKIIKNFCHKKDDSNCGICWATALLDISYYIISELIPVMIIESMLKLTK